jgi:hypothetical protein
MTSGWLLSGVLIAVFAMVAFGHAYCVIRYLTKRTAFSVVPLLGGVLGAVGFYLAPDATLQRFWWLPLLIDYGSFPSLAAWAYAGFRLKT